MPQVETTAGTLEVAALGRTMTHEHVITGPEEARAQWPHAFDREADLQACVAEIEKLRALGVETICDPACSGIGRDVHLNIAVTKATGMRFVMATGVYPAGMRSYPMNPDVLVDYFVHDVEVGIQGSDVKAAFLKCGADEPGMLPAIVTLHEKIAEASLRTGTPIMAHSTPKNEVGLEQMKLFTDAGVDPAMVQIAHIGDTVDVDAIERLLDTGCYIGLDRYGWRGPTIEQRNATLLALLERGYGDRVMLGQDYSMRWNYMSPAAMREMWPDWSATLIFDRVIPDLREAGVSEQQLEAMVGSNVHSWLIGATPSSARATQAS